MTMTMRMKKKPRETRELQSELWKMEKAAEKARDKEEQEKAKWFSERIRSR